MMDIVSNGFYNFSPFNLLFTVTFIIVLGAIIFIFVTNLVTWNKNNKSPLIKVDAELVSKRMDVHHHRHGGVNNSSYINSNSSYYATFELESSDRMELKVSGSDYGMMAEGDIGKLSFKGSRFISFERYPINFDSGEEEEIQND